MEVKRSLRHPGMDSCTFFVLWGNRPCSSESKVFFIEEVRREYNWGKLLQSGVIFFLKKEGRYVFTV